MRVFLALTINTVLFALFFLYLNHRYLAILIGISLIAWFFYYLWRRQQIVLQRVEERIKEQKIILPVEHIMFRAVESSGYSQASGMGYIALTENILYFEMVLLDLVINVPVSCLKGAELVYRLKGVSPGRKMLRIKFRNEKGQEDSIAINVKDLEHWQNTVNAVCKRGA